MTINFRHTTGSIFFLASALGFLITCFLCDLINASLPWIVALLNADITAICVSGLYLYGRRAEEKFKVFELHYQNCGTKHDALAADLLVLASHQLRRPLGATKWHLEALKKQSYFQDAPESALLYVDEAHKQTERAISLVRDLLTLPRLEQDDITHLSLADLERVASGVIDNLQSLADKKHIALHYASRLTGTQTLDADPIMMRETISNLIENALLYTPKTGAVHVTINQPDKAHVRLRVRDNGIGIPPKDQTNVFQKFFRSPKAISMNPEGNGIGLHAAKSYIEEHGGSILIKSKEGNGTTVTALLPTEGASAS